MQNRPALYWAITAILILVAAAPLAYAAQNARGFGAETRASDLWFKTRRLPPRADLVLVARDAKTLQEMGAPGHADYGALIRKLKAD
ncbi:MAG TPA: hypothetical protein VFU47_08400, partial [Armatimonadota bacterium]|nr:hypothetical protein [Armatimonadota bacterium]